MSFKKINIVLQIIIFTFATSFIITNAQTPHTTSLKSTDDSNLYSFESSVLPSTWKAVDGGAISISTKHYKEGANSLLWQYKNGSKLECISSHITTMGDSKNGGIMFWIYSNKATNNKLVFNLKGNDQIVKTTFNVAINFTGWRAVWVHFREDLNYDYSNNKIVKLEIVSPNNTEGELFFELVEFATSISWKRSSDFQFQNNKHNKVWKYYEWIEKTPTSALPQSITSKDITNFELVESKLEKWLIGSNNYSSNEYYKLRKATLDKIISDGIERFNTLNIVRHSDGRVTGTPLFSSRDSRKPKFSADISQQIFWPLVLDYKLNHNASSLDKFHLLHDYFIDQGWDEGSGLGTIDHETIRSSGWANAMFLMRKELKDAGKLAKTIEIMKWYFTFNKMFVTEDTETTADEMRTLSLFKLSIILMMDDSTQKVQFINEYTKWLNSLLKPQPGWADCIKPDFTGYHHRGVYASAYAPNALHQMAIITHLLNSTTFQISDNSMETLRQCLLTQRIMSNTYETPASINGRFPKNNIITATLLPAFACMALNDGEKETRMIKAFKRLWKPQLSLIQNEIFKNASIKISNFNTLGSIETMIKAAESTSVAEVAPSGFWSKPYGGFAVKRQNEWMALVKGYSQYIFDFESSGDENVYGRYISNGNLQIMANAETSDSHIDGVSSGYNLENGWDWSRWPGTTYKYLPLDKLNHNITEEHRNFSDETFVGSTSLKERYGIYSMKLHDRVFDNSFRANKSWIFVDNYIVCLGSNINNTDASNNTETALFQFSMNKTSTPITINGISITNFPYTYLGNGRAHIISDPGGNYYYLPNGTGLNIARQTQYSKSHSDKQNTQGNYSTAWINHTGAPKNAEYEYAAIIQPETTQAEQFKNSPPYVVERKDDSAHIVNIPSKKIRAYAFFSALNTFNDSLIEEIDTPSLIMTQKSNDSLQISLCDPDFGRPHITGTDKVNSDNVFHDSETSEVTLTIKGKWQLTTTNNKVSILHSSNERTTLLFNCFDAKTVEVALKKADISTDIDTDNNGNGVTVVYPNPATQFIFVKGNFTNDDLKLELIDNSGKIVKTEINRQTMSLENIAEGVYIIKIYFNSKVHSRQVVVY